MRFFLSFVALAVAASALAQEGKQLVQILPTPEHPIRFRGEVFIERGRTSASERQDRTLWYARGQFLLECSPDLVDGTSYDGMHDTVDVPLLKGADKYLHKRLKDALSPFSTAKISKATYRVHAKEKRQQFIITFADPELVSQVETALRVANIGEVVFLDDWTLLAGVPNDRVFEPRVSTSDLYATGDNDPFYHHAHNERTRAWSHFSIKAPMAWDVTMGSSDVVLGIIDVMKTCDPSPTTTDLRERRATADTGSVRRIVSSTTNAYTGLAINTGNGIDKSTYPIKSGHGYSVLGAAVARANNDGRTSPPSGSAVGACPSCDAVVFPLNPPPTFFTGDPCTADAPNAIDGIRDNSLCYDIDMVDDFDLDLTKDANDRMKRLDILNCSYVGGNGELHKRLLRNGVVIVAAAGNNWGKAPFDPAATVIINRDPALDTKIIAVGSIDDGELLDATCAPWTSSSRMLPPVWKGTERFTPNFLFSPGNRKFSMSSPAERELDKRAAYIDLVAPGGNVWTLYELTGAKPDPRGYAFQSGTSIATAIVSGVAGLMLSIRPNMGVEMDTITDLPAKGANGLDVQRRLYNILTFTATKIPDLDPAYPYVGSDDDPLRRSWSRRMGFGKVDAFRAVAQSIPAKGAYEYSASGTLSFSDTCRNAAGIKLLHWGSEIRDSVDWPLQDARGGTAGNDGIVSVLAHGGRSMPGESHNNRGVTRLRNTSGAITLTVPDSAALCIDGMVLNEGSSHLHSISATSTAASIHIDGLVRNVVVIGRLRVGDLIADGTSGDGLVRFTLDGDLYGRLVLKERASLDVTGADGRCRVRPGGGIQLDGAKNATVRNAAELEFDHAAFLGRSGEQELIAESGGIIRVRAGAKVSLDGRIRVRSGSSLIIGDSAVVFLRDLVVERGGTFEVRPGAHVSFGSSVITVDGRFLANGGSRPKERITFTSRIADNCRFDAREHILMQGRTKVRGVGDPRSIYDSRLMLRNVDAKNVGFSVTNIETAPIENCAFSMHRSYPSRSLDSVWMMEPSMVSTIITERPADASSDYLLFSVLSSSFTDSAGSVPVGNYHAPYGRSMERYTFAGIHARGHVRADVTGCRFSFLRDGIVAIGNIYATANQCTFTDQDHGVRMQHTTPRVCDNDFTLVEHAVVLHHAEQAYHNDNRIASTRIGFRLYDCAMQAFRGNEFNDYWRGIVATYSAAALTSLRVPGPRDDRELYGRNRFEVSDPLPFFAAPQLHPNPFMRRVDPGAYNADVAMLADLASEDIGGLFLLRCGLNRFSTYATSHIAYDAPSQLVIDASLNNFPPYAAVRAMNVMAAGAPLNVDALTDKLCGPIDDLDDCSKEPWRDGRDEINTGEGGLRAKRHTTRPTERTEHLMEPIAVSINDTEHLATIMAARGVEILPGDVLLLTDVTGSTTVHGLGPRVLTVRRKGADVLRGMLLITP